MADRLISEVDPAELANAVITALRDAGIDFCEGGDGDDEVSIDGHVSVPSLGAHLKRILLLDPPPPAS